MEKTAEAAKVVVSGELIVTLETDLASRSHKRLFKVQVASFPKKVDAENMKAQLEENFSGPVTLQYSPTTQTYRVRIGAYAQRESALNLATILIKNGYPQTWVVEEADELSSPTHRIAIKGNQGGPFKASSNGFLFVPPSQERFIKVNEKSYRGSIEVICDKNKLTVVNELAMEDYLKSVVPSELPPGQFPEMEALKAQAVAARTYALRHLGQFRSNGFDLLATEKSQVYNGISSENPMSTQAVTETAGLAVYYNDEPINALYTSTCGSRTEDFNNVFGGEPVPYLRSVACAPDQTAQFMDKERRIVGTKQEPIHDGFGNPINRELVILAIQQVLQTNNVTQDYLLEKPTSEEIQRWIRRVNQLINRKGDSVQSSDVKNLETLASFANYLVDTLFPTELVDPTLSAVDADYYLANFRDAALIPTRTKKQIAFLLRKNILIPFPDNTIRPYQRLTRSFVLGTLFRILELTSSLGLESGSVIRVIYASQELQIKNSHRVFNIKFSKDPYLFQRFGKATVAADTLKIIGGEEVSFHLASNEIDFLEARLNPSGVANDRYSKSGRWEVSLTNEEARKKLNSILPLGDLIDLRPQKFGSSHRIIELKVIGSRGEFSLKGLKIRTALGLRDTLFTITRQYSPSGGIVSRFIFSGRGWGHGVGLCQTGAFGMALAGDGFDKILRHYYSGVEIKRAY